MKGIEWKPIWWDTRSQAYRTAFVRCIQYLRRSGNALNYLFLDTNCNKYWIPMQSRLKSLQQNVIRKCFDIKLFVSYNFLWQKQSEYLRWKIPSNQLCCHLIQYNACDKRELPFEWIWCLPPLELHFQLLVNCFQDLGDFPFADQFWSEMWHRMKNSRIYQKI